MPDTNEHNDGEKANTASIDSLGFFGSLFEEDLPRTTKEYAWKLPFEKPAPVVARARVTQIDDDPGALRSGRYVWHASLALCDHLVDRLGELGERNKVRSILELGAGCAIPSLVALQIFSRTAELVVVTDYDENMLDWAKLNLELTLPLMDWTALIHDKVEGPKSVPLRDTARIQVDFRLLDWESPCMCQAHQERVIVVSKDSENEKTWCVSTRSDVEEIPSKESLEGKCFDLILGCDLIDCSHAVAPLFRTIYTFLRKGRQLPESSIQAAHKKRSGDYGRCLLAQSFLYDDETEQEISTACHRFRLQRTVLANTFDSVTSGARGYKLLEFQIIDNK